MGFIDAGDERRPINCTHFSQVNEILFFFIYLFFIITALFRNTTHYILDYYNSIYIDMEEITTLSSFAESEPANMWLGGDLGELFSIQGE